MTARTESVGRMAEAYLRSLPNLAAIRAGEDVRALLADRDEAVSELNAAITRLTALTKERDAALAQVEALRAALAKAESWRTLLTEATDGNAIDMLEREHRRNELGDVIAAVLGLGRKDGHK